MLDLHTQSVTGETRVTFSIVVPTCGRLELLSRALRSIQAQSHSDWECIVINDDPEMFLSVDRLVLSLSDQRIKAFHNKRNEGVAITRNEGIARSTGIYIAFLDDDDYWLPNHLAGVLTSHLTTSEHIVVYTNYIQRWQNDIVAPRSTLAKLPLNDTASGLLDGSFNIISMSTVSIPRYCFTVVGLFDGDLKTGQDWDIYLRLSTHFRFIRAHQYSVVYFHHFDGRLTSNYRRRIDSLQMIVKKWRLDQDFLKRKASQWKYMALDNMMFAAYKGDIVAKRHAIQYYFSFPLPFQSPSLIFRLLLMAALPFKLYSDISHACHRLRSSNDDGKFHGNDIFQFDYSSYQCDSNS